jgi:hypothetical protein
MYCSLNIEFVPPLRIYFPFEFGSPRSSFAPPCQAGPASGSDTTRKPLAPRPSLIPPFRVPPGQKHYIMRGFSVCSSVLVDELDYHLYVLTRFAKFGQEAGGLVWVLVVMHRRLECPFPIVEAKEMVVGTLWVLRIIDHRLLAHIAGNPHTSPGYLILVWTWVGAENLPKILEGI